MTEKTVVFQKHNLSEEQINILIKGSSFLIISGITPSLSKYAMKIFLDLLRLQEVII